MFSYRSFDVYDDWNREVLVTVFWYGINGGVGWFLAVVLGTGFYVYVDGITLGFIIFLGF